MRTSRRRVARVGLVVCAAVLLLLVVGSNVFPVLAAPGADPTSTLVGVGGSECDGVTNCVVVPIIWGDGVGALVAVLLVLLVYGVWRVLWGALGVT